MAASITSTLPARIVAVFLGFSLMLFGVSVKSFVASPATLSFSSANPDGTPTVQATLTYEIDAGAGGDVWTLTVSGSSSTFTNCSFLPASAVRVTCANVSITGGGTGSCGSSFDLSTSPGTIASGLQTGGSDFYTILVNYSLIDAWKYQGKLSPSCALTLNYTVTAY